MPGDPPPGELVDRAYDVGAFATAGVEAAAPDAPLPERRGLIRALGIILIVFGAICALMTVVMTNSSFIFWLIASIHTATLPHCRAR